MTRALPLFFRMSESFAPSRESGVERQRAKARSAGLRLTGSKGGAISRGGGTRTDGADGSVADEQDVFQRWRHGTRVVWDLAGKRSDENKDGRASMTPCAAGAIVLTDVCEARISSRQHKYILASSVEAASCCVMLSSSQDGNYAATRTATTFTIMQYSPLITIGTATLFVIANNGALCFTSRRGALATCGAATMGFLYVSPLDKIRTSMLVVRSAVVVLCSAVNAGRLDAIGWFGKQARAVQEHRLCSSKPNRAICNVIVICHRAVPASALRPACTSPAPQNTPQHTYYPNGAIHTQSLWFFARFLT